MSKTIYDKALDNTQTLLALVNLQELNSKKKLDMLNQIEQALEQVKKQENLLRHYKDLAEVRKELYDLTINFKPSNKDRMTVLFVRENLVSDIIKELEDE